MLLGGKILYSKSWSWNLSWRLGWPLSSLLQVDRQGSLQLLYRLQECSCQKQHPSIIQNNIPSSFRMSPEVFEAILEGSDGSSTVVWFIEKRCWLFKCACPISNGRPVSAYFFLNYNAIFAMWWCNHDQNPFCYSLKSIQTCFRYAYRDITMISFNTKHTDVDYC